MVSDYTEPTAAWLLELWVGLTANRFRANTCDDTHLQRLSIAIQVAHLNSLPPLGVRIMLQLLWAKRLSPHGSTSLRLCRHGRYNMRAPYEDMEPLTNCRRWNLGLLLYQSGINQAILSLPPLSMRFKIYLCVTGRI